MHAGDRTMNTHRRGFTLIELLVVMAVLATLLTLALPRYVSGLERSREAVLRHDPAVLRETLDRFRGDTGRYPASLDELVTARYLRNLPRDPITGSASTWVGVPPPDPELGGVYDVHSGAAGEASDGTEYHSW
jgi:general secretion pathway protein G